MESRTWFDPNFVQLETALEILATANGFRSSWIYQEEEKQQPDYRKIEQWRAEQREIFSQIQKVRLGHQEEINYVLNVVAEENNRNFTFSVTTDRSEIREIS